ncbi:hypothetical protein E0Z10_g1634 [Xylaria hypoxylon]|uniref:Uncharacterized protein n=1 Tax=Xylaria hypoxylon TaxID=37992 RepID=A0A4Z0Z8A1_9PEZI|nr:hypothetical protein E0Z10_g1634 [Xylaria hypoxylon]
MKLSQFSLAITVIPSTVADFWIVYQRRHAQIGRVEFTSYGTSFVRDPPYWTCETDAFSHRIFPDQRDARGYNYGVQFEPWSPRAGPLWHDPLLIITMNLYPTTLGLQTVSHDADYSMKNVDNETSGQCHLNRTYILDLDCWFDHPDPRVVEFHVSINGSSMFFCESDIEMDDDGYSWDPLLQGRNIPLLPPNIPIIPPKSQD